MQLRLRREPGVPPSTAAADAWRTSLALRGACRAQGAGTRPLQGPTPCRHVVAPRGTAWVSGASPSGPSDSSRTTGQEGGTNHRPGLCLVSPLTPSSASGSSQWLKQGSALLPAAWRAGPGPRATRSVRWEGDAEHAALEKHSPHGQVEERREASLGWSRTCSTGLEAGGQGPPWCCCSPGPQGSHRLQEIGPWTSGSEESTSPLVING